MAFTLSDLQAAVIDDLNDPNFSATRLARYLNYGQLAIFNTHAFRFCEKLVTSALTIGQYTQAEQSDWQSTIGGVLVDPTTSTRRFQLNEDNYLPSRKFFARYPTPATENPNMPTAWTEFGGVLYFNCPVDKAYSFTQRYYRVPMSMTNTTPGTTDIPTVPEAFREILEFYALYRAEKFRGNHDIAGTYKQDFEDGLENMTIKYSSANMVATTKHKNYRTRQ